jgi:hypothetical protein
VRSTGEADHGVGFVFESGLVRGVSFEKVGSDEAEKLCF